MKSFEIITDVRNGSFNRNINRIREAIRSYEGKTLTLSLKVARKERSNQQNSYYWAVIVVIWKKLIQDEWGEFFTSKEVHEFLKDKPGYSYTEGSQDLIDATCIRMYGERMVAKAQL